MASAPLSSAHLTKETVMTKEPQAGQVVPVGYPVPRRAVLAGTVAAGVLAWSRRPAGPAAAQANRDPGWAGRPANVRVSQDAFTMHAEPSLAANPADPRNLLAACMAWQAGQRGLATYASFDGGGTWHSNGLLPGIRPAYDGDVTVAFDRQGTGYVNAWTGSQAQPQRGQVRLWHTFDGGHSFTAPVTVAAGLVDHPWMAADRWARTGPGTVYVAGDYFGRGGLVFTRSTDGGHSFEPLRFPDPASGSVGGRAPMVTVAPGGLAAIAYYVELPDATQQIKVVTTADYGQTLGPPVYVTHVTPPPIIGHVNTTTGGPSITATADGALHLAVATVDTTAKVSELLLFSSPDHGRTWTASATVARSATTVYFQPQLATGPGGRFALSAFALPVATGQVSVALFISQPYSTRFGPPLTVTTRPFNPNSGTQQGWIGDYQGLTATPSAFHPLWNDTRTGRLQIFTASIKPG
jgi:hypothetical protein